MTELWGGLSVSFSRTVFFSHSNSRHAQTSNRFFHPGTQFTAYRFRILWLQASQKWINDMSTSARKNSLWFSLSYRSEHNEEDTGMKPRSTTNNQRKKHTTEGEKGGRGGGRHIINTNTPFIYFKENFGQFVVKEKKKREKKAEVEANMCKGRKANKCKRYNLLHILNEHSASHKSRPSRSLPESQHTITLLTQRHLLFIFSKKTALLLPTPQSKHKTFVW